MAKQVIENDKFSLSRIINNSENNNENSEDKQLVQVLATPIIKDFSKIVIEASDKDGSATDVYIETITEKFVEKLLDVIKSPNIDIATNEDGTELILTADLSDIEGGGNGTCNCNCGGKHKIKTYSAESNEYQGIAEMQYIETLDLDVPKNNECVVCLNLIIAESENYKGFNISATSENGANILLRDVLYLHNPNPTMLTIEAKYKIITSGNPDTVRFFIDKQVNDNVPFNILENSGWIAWFKGEDEELNENCSCGSKFNHIMRTYDNDLIFDGIVGMQHLAGFDLDVEIDTDCTVALNLIVAESNNYRGFDISAVSSDVADIRLMKPIYLFDDLEQNKVTLEAKFKIITGENPVAVRFFIDKQVADNIEFVVCKNSSWIATYTNKHNSCVSLN